MSESLPQESKIQVVTDPAVNSYILAQWAIERLNEPDLKSVSDLGPYRAFGVVRRRADGAIEPLAVVIFNGFRELPYGNDLRVIIVADSPRWCLPGVLRELFEYPFEVAGCERLTATIRDGNHRSLKLCQGLGFKKEGTARRAHDGKTNTIVLGMLRHECKWLEPRKHESSNGQEVFFSSEATRSGKNNRRTKRRRQRRANRERAAERG